MERYGMNETSAKQWLEKAWHNLSGAKIFYDAYHYTDVTAVELHYSIEKSLKAFLAYENKKIPKTHDLVDIYKLVQNFIDLNDDLVLLKQVTKYHIEESYPVLYRVTPSREEIEEVLEFASELFERVCNILSVDEDVKR